ncbi:indolepyruvate oxidoreductase [Candidatus Acidianus copahuensis]|uniref:Indolepyruvate oxidoreductase n=1 Tax=Candidatus Acidianus copahuensis TaxID=1160895 RepID=A0A031LL94_9CREN|nr:2-oxoacid:acceptor oxidoreductase family protein [Candidatus Acidianus copahuensis]EZQ01999.1 indolepyruvate oxidoreductase [Candidatus Acidianus copahuensis]
MVKLNLIVGGIGGQGIITLGKMITSACEKEGLKVLVSEMHGLAQRGGAVNIHVRIGDVYAPTIPLGGADCIMGLETNEALRNLSYANNKTLIILNELSIRPVLPGIIPKKVEEVEKLLSGYRVVKVNLKEISEKIGDKRVINSAILGFAYGLNVFPMISESSFIETMRGENNVKSFYMGMRIAHDFIRN